MDDFDALELELRRLADDLTTLRAALLTLLRSPPPTPERLVA